MPFTFLVILHHLSIEQVQPILSFTASS